MKNYQVEVQTGMVDHAGTDAKVYIQLFGEKSTSKELRIDNKNDNFEKGDLDKFTVQSDDLGWIDKIRIFHDNSGDKPGWFVNYIKVTDTEVGLSWRVDLNRWLSKKDDDKKIDLTLDVPIGGVKLAEGLIKTVYLGYIPWRYSNEGQSTTHAVNKFGYTYKKGVTVDVTKTKSVTVSASLEATYFGIGGKFGTEVTQSVASTLNTTEEETFEMGVDFDYEVAAGKSITVAFVFYQSVLDGEVQAGGVSLGYEQKFLLTYQTFVFDGFLSDAQLAEKVKEKLQTIAKVALPAKFTAKSTNVVLEQTELKSVNPVFVGEVTQKMSKGVPATKLMKANNDLLEVTPINSQAFAKGVKVN